MTCFSSERRICFAEMVGETNSRYYQYSTYNWYNQCPSDRMAGNSIYCLFIFKVLCITTYSRLFFSNSHLLKWLQIVPNNIHHGGLAASPNLCLCWKWSSWVASSFLITIGSDKGLELGMVPSPYFWFLIVKDFYTFLAHFHVISD